MSSIWPVTSLSTKRPVPMVPNGPDKISDADLKAAIDFILKS